MKKYLPLALLTLALGANSLVAQTNFKDYDNTLLTVDYKNNGFVDDIIGIDALNDDNTLTLWENYDSEFVENEVKFKLPSDLESLEFLKGKMVSGDFDNDGYHDDIAAIYEIGLNKTSVTVWINNRGKYKPQQWWYGADFDANQTNLTLVSGDFDNDGFVDDIAAFYDYQNEKTKVFVWNSNGEKFAWPGTWWVGDDFNSARIQGKMVVGDFDHDGFIDDIAALYDYVDNYCKIFMWKGNSNGFSWPYTWFSEADFTASNLKGNVISGDFNKNGFVDNVAAFYVYNEHQSEVLVWQRDTKGFDYPEAWFYGNNEGKLISNRMLAIDSDGNGVIDQFTGIAYQPEEATLSIWEADNNSFIQNINLYAGTILSSDCEKDGGCLPENLINQLVVYPNPAYEHCSVFLPGDNTTAVTLNVYNNLGQVVYSKETSCGVQESINTNNLEPGNYLVSVIGEQINFKEKLVIR